MGSHLTSNAWTKACLHTKLHLDPSNPLAAIHQRYRQTGQTDNGPVAYGEPLLVMIAQKWILSVDCINILITSSKLVDYEIGNNSY